MPSAVQKIRGAVRGALLHASITALVPATRIIRRPRKALTEFPTITFYDSGIRPDNSPRIPLMDRNFTIDIWAKTLDEAEVIAALVEARLQGGSNIIPLAAPEARVQYFAQIADIDIAEEDGEVVHKTQEYRCLAYAA